ncbi:MAG: LCP family protein [Clostridiales bacterium]|nr:LCP family protein [Clostridiales bacterium]
MGSIYVGRTLQAADKITTVKTEVAEMGIYVQANNTDDFNQTASGYTYGILAQMDRENTDQVVEQLNEQLGISIAVKEYDSLTALMDGLFGGETNAVILNSAYLDVLEEMEGYENIRERIREVTVTHVETEVPQASLPAEEAGGSQDQSVFTVYISGVDTRSTELIAKSRCDVNILAVINADTRQVALISTPRDYYVPLSISDGVPDKLTHAGIYGVQVSMDTLSMLYDTPIEYYFRVNFTGFKDIIDALGGVTVVSDYTFDTKNVSGYHFNKGENFMDGDEALAFCRERYAFATGDNQRGKNQLAVIKGVLNKCLSTDMLLHYTDVLDAVEDSFETSVPYDVISSLVRSQISGGSDWNIVSYSVTGTGDRQVPYSMSQSVYVMVPDQSTVDQAKSLIQTVRDGGVVEQP